MGNQMLAQILGTALVFVTFSFVNTQFHLVGKGIGRFSYRRCWSDNDCVFKSPIGLIFLTCEGGGFFCMCKTLDDLKHPVDGSRYEVTEILTSDEFDNERMSCQVQDGGPCGTDGDTTIDCKKDTSCIAGKCRNPLELQTNAEGGGCDDNLDCKQGLTCENSFIPMDSKRCRSAISTWMPEPVLPMWWR